jgi:hypothetical protein
MSRPLYAIPGMAAAAQPEAPESAVTPERGTARSVAQVLRDSQVEAVLEELDRDLVGLAPVSASATSRRCW